MQANKSLWYRVFNEPEAIPLINDSKEAIKKRYIFWRNSIFATSYIIYMVAYFCRKSFTIAGPLTSGLSSTDMAFVMAVGAIVYGIGKTVNGFLADRGSVRYGLSINAIIAGICSALMAFTPWFSENLFSKSHKSMVAYMCVSWGIAQWFQSALFPYCAKSLVRWFPNSTRSFWWCSWSTSHEIGSFIAMNALLPIGILVEGWFGCGGLEAVFIFPFILSSIIGFIGLFSLRDKPISIGLPDVEEIYSTSKLSKEEKKEIDEEGNLKYFDIFKRYILKNKVIWNLSLIYFCVYVFRNGPVDWMFKILVKEKKFSNFGETIKNTDPLNALQASILPLLGFLGTLLAPFISEKIFKGRRAPANFWCLFIGAFSVIGIWFGVSEHSPIYNNEILRNVFRFVFLGVAGFTVCVPQVLVGGLSAVENSSKRVASAATGFASLFGYFGAAFGHIINGYLIESSNKIYKDSRLVLIYWGIVALIGALLCIPLWNTKTNKEYSH